MTKHRHSITNELALQKLTNHPNVEVNSSKLIYDKNIKGMVRNPNHKKIVIRKHVGINTWTYIDYLIHHSDYTLRKE